MDSMELHMMHKDAHEKGKEVAKNLTDALNSMSFQEDVMEGFAEGMTQQHRTLQQLSMGAIYKVILKWAEMAENGRFDDRNKATVELCKKIKDLGEAYFPFI